MSKTNPFSLAIHDFFYYKENFQALKLRRDDGLLNEVDLTTMDYNSKTLFSDIEEKAFEMCSGKILDVGAGLGRHSRKLEFWKILIAHIF